MSETNNPELKTTTKLYTLSLEDFSPEKAPQQPKPYHPGDKITRENFVSLLIYSFAISRGQLAKQVAFFNWVQMNSGFEAYPIWGELVRNNKDMSEDIRDYFSPAERDMFMNAFGKVGKHDRYKNGEFDQESEIRGGLSTVRSYIKTDTQQFILQFHVAPHQSFTEFRENLEKYDKNK